MEELIIRLLPNGHAQAALVFQGKIKLIHETPATLQDIIMQLPTAQGERRVIVLVPGQDVLLTSVLVLPKQRRHLHTLLPFLVEEQLADDVHKMHIAHGTEADGTMPVAVVRTSLMQQWIDQLSEAGIAAQTMLPDMLALPFHPGCWSLLYDDAMAWLRTGWFSGVAVETDMLAPMLELSISSSELVSIECLTRDPSQMEALQLHYPLVSLNYNPFDTTAFNLFCEHIHLATDFNLLQGEFAPKLLRTQSHRLWRNIGQIAAMWFVVQMLFDGGQALYLSTQANKTHHQSVSLYQTFFPADTKIVNPIQQMKSHLAPSLTGSETDFLTLLGKFAGHWNGGDAAPAQIQSLSYIDSNHVLTLNVTAVRIEALNSLAAKLNAGDLNAKLVSVVNEKDSVKGQLAVSGSDHE